VAEGGMTKIMCQARGFDDLGVHTQRFR